MKNVVLVIYSMGVGGAERVATNISDYMILKGINFSIISLHERETEYILNDNVHTERLFKIGEKSDILQLLFKLRKSVKSKKPDVVLSFGAYDNILTIIALLFSKVKIVISERGSPKRELDRKLLVIMRKFLYKLADGIVFQTKEAMEYFCKDIQKKSVIIPNPISKSLPEIVDYGCIKRTKEIVSVGRLTKAKNFPLLINAFSSIVKKNPEYKLIIYGEGELREHLEKLIRRLNLEDKIFLPGNVNDVLQKISKASLFVLSSEYEGIPNALLEALSMGIPCISTDCENGGARELIENNINGVIVPRNNEYELIKAIDFMLNNPEKSRFLGFNAIKVREKYDFTKINSMWYNYLEHVVENEN